MNEIKDYIHTFEIDRQEIQLLINYKKGYWTSEIKKGDTGCNGSYGGVYDSLDNYIKAQEEEHRYAFNFFNKGIEKLFKNIIEKYKFAETKSYRKIGDIYLYRHYYKYIKGGYHLKMKIYFNEHNERYYVWWQGKYRMNSEWLFAKTNKIDFGSEETMKMLGFIENNTNERFKLIMNNLKKQGNRIINALNINSFNPEISGS